MSRRIVAGVDLGGTYIKFGIFDMNETGSLIRKWKVPTPDGKMEILQRIVLELQRECVSCELVHVGIGVPGCVDADGMIIKAPNLGWERTDCISFIRQELNVPVSVVNDANAAALGEQFYGSGAGCGSLVFVTLGTGVGGGVIVDHKLVCGGAGAAGELGHMTIEPEEKVVCSCGRRGCLEQYASASGIVRLAREVLGREDTDSSLCGCDRLTAKDVFDAAKQQDGVAVMVLERFGRTLGRALALVSCTIDPEVFVIGGGVSAAGSIVLDYIEKYYRQFAYAPVRDTRFCLASLGNDAGIYGAARLAMLNFWAQ